MDILITGALGHIGSRLIRELPILLPGSRLILLDNLSTQRYGSLFHLPEGGHYRFLEGDIMKEDLVGMFAGIDAVVHLAAITDAPASFENREKVEEVNYLGTERVARACADAGCAMVFLSTTSVYGTQSEVMDEDCRIEELKPQSPYAESKLNSERLLQEIGTTRGLRFASCRFGTIFGVSQGMRFHTAVNKFVWQACLGIPITVWRTAIDQKRPYLDLGDAVRALAFLLGGGIFPNDVYNVVTANASVGEIVRIIRLRIPGASDSNRGQPHHESTLLRSLPEEVRGVGVRLPGELGERDLRNHRPPAERPGRKCSLNSGISTIG